VFAKQNVVLETDLPARVRYFTAEVEFVVVLLPFYGAIWVEPLEEAEVASARALPCLYVETVLTGDGVDERVGEHTVDV
jgi:hypothetical protein